MRNLGRVVTLLGFLGVGCTDTFDLLPEDSAGAPGTGGWGGSFGTGGIGAYAGKPGGGGKGGGSSGRSSGGTGGSGARGGSGPGAGTGGTAAGDDGGTHDCSAKPDTPYWSTYLGICVACRYHHEDCPGGNCESDCDSEDNCDPYSNTCKPACGMMGQTCKQGQVCDFNRDVCVTCTTSQGITIGCPAGQRCMFTLDGEACVDCLSSYDCSDDLVCNSMNKCVPCTDASECNAGGAQGPKVCYGGRCVFPPP